MKKILIIILILVNISASFFAQYVNRIPGMAEIAIKIKTGEPDPIWQTPLKELEIDDLLVVPDAGVLVGLTSISWDVFLGGAYIPSYGPYIMYDANTGQEKWSYSRDKSYNNSYQVLVYTPVILIRYDTEKKSKYIALDPQTGNELWSFSASLKSQICFNLSGSYLFLEEQKKSTIKLSAINLKNGNQLWQSLEERFPANDPLPEMNLNGENLFLADNALAAYSFVNGKALWFIDGIGLNSDKSFLALLPGGDLVVPSANGILSRIDRLGKFVWQTKFENQPGILLTDSSKLYLQIIEGGKQDKLFCYSLTDGHLFWGNELKGQITSHFLLAEGKIVYTYKNSSSENCLEILDAQTGKLIRDQVLSFQPKFSLADRLIAYPGQAVVIWERGVGAFSLTDGTRLWLYNIKDPEGVYENLVNTWGSKYQDYLNDNSKDKRKTKPDYRNEFQKYSSNSLVAWSENNEAEVFRRTNPIISATSKSTHSDKQLALSDQKMAIENSITSLALQRSFDKMSLSIELFQMTNTLAPELGRQIGQAIVDKKIQASSMSRAQHWYWGLRTINKIQQNNVQGNYYIHAFAGNDTSFSVVLVNLKNGYWHEIRTSPYCKDYFDETMNFRLPTLSADGKRFFVRGIGLDTTKWKQAKAKDLLLLNDRGWFYHNGDILPAPSLLAYDIKDEDFINTDSIKYAMSHFYGYSDADGKIVIQPKFEWAGPFVNGIAQVQEGGKYGLIEKSGKFLAKPIYDEIGYFSGGVAIVEFDGKYGLIDRTGHYVLDPQFGKMEQPYSNRKGTLYELNGKWGCFLDSGKNIKPQFDKLWSFSDGLAMAKSNGKMGFIDFTGKFVIPAQFDTGKFFNVGLCPVKINGKWGAIDKTGKITLQPIYSYLDINEGVAVFGYNNAFGLMDALSGKEITKPEYDDAYGYNEGLATMKKNHKWGYIDKTGNVVIPFQFNDAYPFSEDSCALVELKDMWGKIDRTGKFVIEAKYFDITTLIRSTSHSNSKAYIYPVYLGKRCWIK